jgi:hypothetical protein
MTETSRRLRLVPAGPTTGGTCYLRHTTMPSGAAFMIDEWLSRGLDPRDVEHLFSTRYGGGYKQIIREGGRLTLHGSTCSFTRVLWLVRRGELLARYVGSGGAA